MTPFVRAPQHGGIYDFSVTQQVHQHPWRTDAILVFIIFPFLPDYDRHVPRVVGVRYLEAVPGLFHNARISLKLIFRDRVTDLSAVRILRQSFPAPIPTISSCNRLDFICQFRVIRIQMDRDAFRQAHSGRYIRPFFAAAHRHRLRCMRVHDRKAALCRSGYCILIRPRSIRSGDDFGMQFFYRIVNRLSVFIAVKVAKLVRPAIALIQHCCVNRIAICLQEYSDV